MNKWLELLVGLILVVVPILLASSLVWPAWWTAAFNFLIGGVFWALVGLGALFILLGISDLKG